MTDEPVKGHWRKQPDGTQSWVPDHVRQAPMSISSIIMDLERIARDYEAKLEPADLIAQRLEANGELLFRLAGRIRHGRES